MTYKRVYKRNTPQSQPMEAGQIQNHAGGYVFQVTPWTRLGRFLVLGSDKGTYYQHAPALTKENAVCVSECYGLDPNKTAETICEISESGRAPKNDHAIFALALGAIHPNVQARQASYAAKPRVCRTGYHQFLWAAYCEFLGKGTGRGYKRAAASFYNTRDTDDLAYQMVKYRQREGFTHKRLIELSNQGPLSNDELRKNLFRWARGKEVYEKLPEIVEGHIEAMSLEPRESKRLVNLITNYKLPWEAIPTWAMTSPDVWDALIPTTGLTALIRNLGNITASGALTSQNYEKVTERLLNEYALDKARIHPFNVLQALAVYGSGKGLKGKKTWLPVRQVTEALDEAFYKCFKYAEPTGKRKLIALDVSGSMGSPIGSPRKDKAGRYTIRNENPLTCREAAAAMCLVGLKTEKYVDVVGFSHGPLTGSGSSGRWGDMSRAGLIPLDISPKDRLDKTVTTLRNQRFGATDCSLPFRWAQQEKKEYDSIEVWTDNETWSGHIHPKEALRDYRRFMGLNTKLIVCGMTATDCSIADPNDPGMMDVAGLDSAVPTLIADFIRK